jgi:hypothetical protein
MTALTSVMPIFSADVRLELRRRLSGYAASQLSLYEGSLTWPTQPNI